MSYMRVQVFETQQSWSETMKMFQKTVKPTLNALKKEKVLLNWSSVQTSDHKDVCSGMVITEFPNKAAVNKYLKAMNVIRDGIAADTGMQFWLYHGPVKASG